MGVRVMDVGVIMVPESIRSKLGDEATRDLVDLINASAKVTRDNMSELVVERFERRLVQEIAGLEGRLRNFVLVALGLAVGFLTFVIAVAAWFKG